MDYYVFGAGYNSPFLIRSLEKSGYHIKGVIDNDKSKRGTTVSGYPIGCFDDYPYDSICKSFILVSISNRDITSLCLLYVINHILSSRFLSLNKGQATQDQIIYESKKCRPSSVTSRSALG